MLFYMILAAITLLLAISLLSGKIDDIKVKMKIRYIDNDIVLAYGRSRDFLASCKNNELFSPMLISLYNRIYGPKKIQKKPYSFYCLLENESSCFSEDTFTKMEEYLKRFCARGFVLSFTYIAVLAFTISSRWTYSYKIYRYCYERVGPSCDLGSEMADYIEDFHALTIINSDSSSCCQKEIEYTVFRTLFLNSLFYNRASFYQACIDKLNDILISSEADDSQKMMVCSIVEQTLLKVS